MINLKSDNRILIQNSKYSYLVSNYSAGVSTIQIVNTEDFTVGNFIIISEMGKSDAEIFRIGTINSSSGEITLLTAAGVASKTNFPHSESTKVSILPYNEIRFYWTAALGTIADETPVFDTITPLTAWVSLEPASYYTTYEDSSHSTGFGWFVYRNSVTTQSSQTSNPMPYAGFVGNTVASIFADFDSLLNTKELQLVRTSDRFSWFNEAMAVLKNKLNLSNVEYSVSTKQTLNIISGTSEYQLPADFSDIVQITDSSSTLYPLDIGYISVSKIMSYNGDTTKYYLRGRYIGFIPAPTSNTTYYYRYRSKSTEATSISTYIDLPDNAYYSLKEFMMYRACQKFSNPASASYYQSFNNSLNQFILASSKRDANLDSFGIDSSSNA